MRGPIGERKGFAELSALGKINRIVGTLIAVLLLLSIAISPIVGVLAILDGQLFSGFVVFSLGVLLWLVLITAPQY